MAGQGGKVIALGKKDKGSPLHVQEVKKSNKKLDRLANPSQVLNARALEGQLNASATIDGATLESYLSPDGVNGMPVLPDQFPVDAFHVGEWLRPGKRDTEMTIRQELIDQGGNAAAGKTPFGLMTVDNGVMDWIVDKKDQEAALARLSFATYLIDPTDPRSQEHAYALFPEMRSVPDQYHHRILAICEALRTILRDGQIRGKEDHALIMFICGPKFVIPTHPAWDPEGMLSGMANDKINNNEYNYRLGIFNPYNWGAYFDPKATSAYGPADAGHQKQLNLKCMILKRCYPAFRHQGLMDIKKQMLQALYKESPINGKPTTQSAWKHFVAPMLGTVDQREAGQIRYPPTDGKPAYPTWGRV